MATLTETFTNIANSIRLKTETTDKITPENMPSMIEGITTGGNVAELSITSNGTYRAPEGIDGYTPVIVNVPQDGSPPAEAFVITGDCQYKFSGSGWNWFVNQYGNQITTENITNVSHMFYYNGGLKEVPFEINVSSSPQSSTRMFHLSELEKLPKVNNLQTNGTEYMFNGCRKLKEIPDSFCENWNWTALKNMTSSYLGNCGFMFTNCNRVRYISPILLKNAGNPKSTYSYSPYNNQFLYCYALEEACDIFVPENGSAWTSNAFRNSFEDNWRLKKYTFNTNEDGTPKIVNWKNQVIDFKKYIGFSSESMDFYGFTTATQITDDATYQALKDNPDNWTTDIKYSRYNKTSAIETINSLPDTSAYLAANGGTNTIKFYGSAGALTDGGAINTMTEEEIAVAVAKGWTVSFG